MKVSMQLNRQKAAELVFFCFHSVDTFYAFDEYEWCTRNNTSTIAKLDSTFCFLNFHIKFNISLFILKKGYFLKSWLIND